LVLALSASGATSGRGIRCCRAVAALLPDNVAVNGFCQALVTTGGGIAVLCRFQLVKFLAFRDLAVT